MTSWLRILTILLTVSTFAPHGVARASDKADDDVDTTLPRTAVSVGDLEIVLVLKGDRMFAFVDDEKTNAPTGVERLTIENGPRRWELAATDAGVYSVSGVVLSPTIHSVFIEARTSAGVQRVETSFSHMFTQAPAEPASRGGSWKWVAGIGVLLAAGAAGGWGWHRRRRRIQIPAVYQPPQNVETSATAQNAEDARPSENIG